MILDSSLSMEKHVHKIRAAVFSRLRTLGRVRKFLPHAHHKMLVQSLVISHFNFCGSLLSQIEARLLQKLQSAVNASIRALFGRKRRDSVSDLHGILGLLPLKTHFKFRLLLLIFSVMNTCKPVFLRDAVEWYRPSRTLRSARLNALCVPRTKLKFTDRAFSVLAPRHWNSLPPDIRDVTLDYVQFRKLCFSFLSACLLMQFLCYVCLLIWVRSGSLSNKIKKLLSQIHPQLQQENRKASGTAKSRIHVTDWFL